MLPEAPLSRTDDRRNLLLALGAAGVTLAVALGVIGLPALNACSADPRGAITCLRDMADRKFDLPGSVPGQVDETTAAEVPASAPTIVVAETEAPAASGGPLEAPAVDPALPSAKPAPVPVPAVKPATESQAVEVPSAALPPAVSTAPAAVEMAAAPEPESGGGITPVAPEVQGDGPEPVTAEPSDSALTWSAAPIPRQAIAETEQPVAAAPMPEPEPMSVAPATQLPVDVPSATAPQPDPLLGVTEPAQVGELPTAEPTTAAAAEPPAPTAGPPQPPIVVANAEPAGSQPPAPIIAAPVVLAPTIDAIELDGGQSFVSGSGPAGALMRLYADGELIGESPVEEGRWLVEGSNLLDSPRRELRVEAIEPDTGKLLGVAAITVEIELPDGGAPPDARPEKNPDLGSGVGPAPQPETAAPIATAPPTLADNAPPASTVVPAGEPTLVLDPEPTEPAAMSEPASAVIAPEVEPEPLPPLATVVPLGESASVEILGPSTLQPSMLPPANDDADDPSTITLPPPDAPALIAEFDLKSPAPARPTGQPVTMLRLLPFGDPDEGRYNVGKAIIRRGDTLWSIARRYYGHGIHYRTIFHANRELISRPSRIFPGQIFDLPLVTDD